MFFEPGIILKEHCMKMSIAYTIFTPPLVGRWDCWSKLMKKPDFKLHGGLAKSIPVPLIPMTSIMVWFNMFYTQNRVLNPTQYDQPCVCPLVLCLETYPFAHICFGSETHRSSALSQIGWCSQWMSMCICMRTYICIHLYVCVYVYIHTHTYTYTYTDASTYTYTYAYAYIPIHINIRVGGLEHVLLSIHLAITIPIDELIFFRGVGIPPTR